MAGQTGKHWSAKLIKLIPTRALKAVNSVMGRYFITKHGTKQGIVVLGKVVPFGVGAAIGGAMNFAVARGLVKSAHRVFELDGTIYEATEGEVFAAEIVP
ncbi:hypothetical protein GU243_19185 [Pseudarthrobacter psychrotolerans]|uniref:Uncharacterized protein n=1 Tax=Pseudarthrobacter psychrotolerans TaxID=2697569 RepID=A0A6P1NWY6_9MICC|nr:hypothetical protein [Pseudarthrobacter psychrotolerans]QHK21471.1 hypothetical protein GU243_19185 [Pseudarthrobacter psychrotolerans]